MSLEIYDREDLLPDDIVYINNCDMFCRTGGGGLPDTQQAKQFLQELDNAERVDVNSVRYNWKQPVYPLSRLSTGTKILMCVLYSPELCINADECGANVMNRLIHLKTGKIKMSFPAFLYDGKDADDCDILYKGTHFMNVYKFLDAAHAEVHNEAFTVDSCSNKSEHLVFKLVDIAVDATLYDGINVFDNRSSIGKTRLLNALDLYCLLHKLKSILVDSDNFEFVQPSIIKGYDLVLLNNSDLYLEKLNFNELCRDNRIIIADAKSPAIAHLDNVHKLSIDMHKDNLVVYRQGLSLF